MPLERDRTRPTSQGDAAKDDSSCNQPDAHLPGVFPCTTTLKDSTESIGTLQAEVHCAGFGHEGWGGLGAARIRLTCIKLAGSRGSCDAEGRLEKINSVSWGALGGRKGLCGSARESGGKPPHSTGRFNLHGSSNSER